MKDEQIKVIESYLRNQEKERKDFKIGAEFEYFVVDKNTLKSISYYGENGIEKSLKQLLSKNYEGIFENNHLLGLKKGNSTITLEPGCQVEISIKPSNCIKVLEREYKEICTDLMNVFDKKKQVLLACGYRPKDKIEEIKLIPKKRYHFMYDYFKKCGVYAHNMMKQTASTQVAIDYCDENDFYHKMRILNVLSPIFYAFFDNAPYFEGNIYSQFALRANIWDNCDDQRCGLINKTISDKFTYRDYAKYILNQIIIFSNDECLSNKLFKEIFTLKTKELEHALSMVFPDVRIRKYIEIRMFDSLPYPLNFSVIALIKGILYDEKNLKELFEFSQNFTLNDVLKAKSDIKTYGIGTKMKNFSIKEIMIYLMQMANRALSEETSYLLPINNLIDSTNSPKQNTITNINWCKLSASLIKEELYAY